MNKKLFKKIVTLAIALLVPISMMACDNKTNKVASAATSEQKKLIVGLSAEYAPYEFHAMIDGVDTVSGFDVEIAKEIAKDRNAELVIKEMDFKALIGALKAGQIDMIISGMNPTDERKQEIDFSEIYYEARHGVLVRKEDKDKFTKVEDLNDKKIGVQLGSTQQEIAEKIIQGGQLQILANINSLVLELKSGRVDALITEKPVAQMAVNTNPQLSLTEIDIKDGVTGNAVAVGKGSGELLASINKTIKRLQDSGKIDQFVVEANNLATGNQSEEEESFISKYSSVFLEGLKITLIISLITVVLGTLFGALLFAMRTSNISILKIRPLNVIATIYIEIIRGTPMLLQIMLVYSGSKMALGLDISAFASAVIAISLNSAAYISEIVRAGIEAVDRGQMEAAKSLGMPKAMAMRLIIIPQAIKNIIPAIGNEFVTIIKESSIASVIGVGELMFAANIVTGATYKSIEPLIVSALLYFVLTFSLGRLMRYFERRMKASD